MAQTTVNVSQYQVMSTLRTRGYGGLTAAGKQFDRFQLDAATWKPRVTVRSKTDDQEDWEATALSNETTDPTKWLRPYGKAHWDPTNALDDQRQPYREDYSLAWEESVEPETDGLEPDQLAEFKRNGSLHRRGRWVQLEVTSITGAIAVRAVHVALRDRSRPTHGRED